LITAAIRRAGLSAREAARRSEISEGRWRQITAGYQVVSPGVYAHVRGPASTLAKMAVVAGVTPAQLEEAGRPDAAVVLAQMRRVRSPGDEELLNRVRAMDRDQARELLAEIALRLGISIPPHDDSEALPRYGT
jgi:hypothetical protein